MFITKEESERRLKSKRNILGDNYEAPKKYSPDELQKRSSPALEDNYEQPAEISQKRVQEILDQSEGIRRRNGSLQGMTDVQVAIGTTSAILGSKGAGSLYNLSEKQSHAYEQGESSQIDIDRGITRNPNRRAVMEQVKDSLAEKAAHKLGVALDNLTSEKIGNEKHAGNIARIAKDMAVVVDKVTKDNGTPEHVHFHIFRPEPRVLTDYKVVQVHSAVPEK